MDLIPKAVQIFDKTLELAGSSPELKEEVAEFCINNGVNEYAAKLLEAIIRQNPNRADLLFELGKVLDKQGESNRAIVYLQRAGEIDKQNESLRIHLATIYLNIKKPMLAEKPLRELIKINPDNEEARELLKRCV